MDNKKVIQRMQTDEDYRIAMQQHLDELTPDQYRALLTVRAYHERARTYGASFLSLTDHGTMYGLVPLG